jgi:hypothetical protein
MEGTLEQTKKLKWEKQTKEERMRNKMKSQQQLNEG